MCCRSRSSSAKRSSICFRFGSRRRRVVVRVRFIVVLLIHGNGLRRVADLDAQRAAGGGDAEVLIAEATDEVEGFLRRLLLREAQRVRGDLRLHGRAHVRRRAEEAVGGHEPVEPLMRALEVVVLDEERDAPQAVREVGEHRLAQKFVPQRFPEAFDLAERLRMLRPALAVANAAALEELLEFRFAAPRDVLSALVGEHLARLAVLRDAALERVDDQARLVVVRHRPRHEVARVVVHEADEVDRLMATQLELEDVALPELVRLGAFEATLGFVTRFGRHVFGDEPGLVQDASHGRLGDTEAREALEHVADATRAPRRVRLARGDDLVAHGGRGLLARPPERPGGRRAVERCAQRIEAAAVEEGDKLLYGRHRHAKCDRDVSVLRPAHHRLDDADAHVERHRPVPLVTVLRPFLGSLLLLLLAHLFHSSALRVRGSRTTGAMRISDHETTYRWRAAQASTVGRRRRSCRTCRSSSPAGSSLSCETRAGSSR